MKIAVKRPPPPAPPGRKQRLDGRIWVHKIGVIELELQDKCSQVDVDFLDGVFPGGCGPEEHDEISAELFQISGKNYIKITWSVNGPREAKWRAFEE